MNAEQARALRALGHRADFLGEAEALRVSIDIDLAHAAKTSSKHTFSYKRDRWTPEQVDKVIVSLIKDGFRAKISKTQFESMGAISIHWKEEE